MCTILFCRNNKCSNITNRNPDKVYIDKLQLEQLSLLEKLVNINSGTANIAGVHQVGEILRPFFHQLGFKTYWVEEPSYMQRAGTLIAEHSGSMPPTANNIELLKKYSEASISLGYGSIIALDPALRGAADISHVALITQANLDGLGPVGTSAHSEKETLDIKSLPIQTQKAAILMYRLANDH